MALCRTWRSCLLFGLIIVLIDFLTKEWVSALMGSPKTPFALPLVIFSNFLGIKLQITHAVNSGAAWGVLADFPGILVFVRILLISGLIGYLVSSNRRPQWNAPLCLIISGAIGNVIDYFHYGYVVDMIQFRFWGYEYPVFNIADSAIFLGSFWILLSVMFEKKVA